MLTMTSHARARIQQLAGEVVDVDAFRSVRQPTPQELSLANKENCRYIIYLIISIAVGKK